MQIASSTASAPPNCRAGAPPAAFLDILSSASKNSLRSEPFPGNLSSMAQNPDVRWRQRFANFKQALAQLLATAELARTRKLSKLEQQGLIQAFEFTHEMAWNTLKDFLARRGPTARIYGSRDATREAFAADLIEDGDVWMKMLESRNATTHIYDE